MIIATLLPSIKCFVCAARPVMQMRMCIRGLGVGRKLCLTLTKSPDVSEGERGINMYS